MKLNELIQLNELRYNKPMDIDAIEQILNDIVMSAPQLEDDAMGVLRLPTLAPDDVEKHLYKMDEVTVHRILRQLKELMSNGR